MKFFSNEGIGKVNGLFSIDHVIYTTLGLLMIILLLIFTYKLEHKKIKKIIRISFWFVFIAEILKIIWNLTIRQSVTLDNWVPLYYCSFFIYTSFLVGYCKGKAEQFGKSFLFFGQVVAGLAFLFYPSSALLVHPFLHVLSVHSLIYHALSVYIGLLIVLSKYYVPNKKDFPLYLIVLVVFSTLIYCFNLIFKTNMMFLSNPWNIGPLIVIYNFSKILYPILLSLFQIVGSYVVSYIIYNLVVKINNRKRNYDLTK